MRRTDGGKPACPVCGLAIVKQPTCAECGWTLCTPRRPGPVSAEQRQDFDERLDLARRTLDARVAAVMSPDPERFAGLIRGGRPTGAQWKAARRAAEQAMAGAVTDEELSGILAEVLSEVTMDADTVVVEIDDLGISISRLRLDDFWSPLPHRPDPTMAWQRLLPMLAKDDDERRFQLAGGFGPLDRDQLWSTLRQAVSRISRGPAVVLCRPAGWQVLDRAAELIGRRTGGRLVRASPAADGGTLAAFVDRLAATAPLRRGYGLVVAVADPVTQQVHTEVHPLFAPGDRPGAEVSLSARRAPGDRGDVTLAVLVGDGNAMPPAQEQPMVVATARPRASDYRISVVLDGPGRLRITEPAGTKPQARPWPDVLAEVPDRIDAAIGPFDLVCAIDMAGTSDEVGERRRLVRDLLTLLESEYPRAEMLRVSVLGCTDHVFARRAERRNVVQAVPLASVAQAQAALTRLTGAFVVYPDAAPIEDLLYRAARLLSGSHRQGRHARLLLLGQRAPHPRAQGSGQPLPCPFRYDWRAALSELAGACAAACVAVTDAPPRPDQARAWRELGRARLCQRDGTDARQLGAYLGILATNSQRIPIPLAMSK